MSSASANALLGGLIVVSGLVNGWLIFEHAALKDELVETSKQLTISRASAETSDRDLGEVRKTLGSTLSAKASAEGEAARMAAALKEAEEALAQAKAALSESMEKLKSAESEKTSLTAKLAEASATLSSTEAKLASETQKVAQAQACPTPAPVQGAELPAAN